jgi:hypothetical protein
LWYTVKYRFSLRFVTRSTISTTSVVASVGESVYRPGM